MPRLPDSEPVQKKDGELAPARKPARRPKRPESAPRNEQVSAAAKAAEKHPVVTAADLLALHQVLIPEPYVPTKEEVDTWHRAVLKNMKKDAI
jgi:hypothetical protein